MDTMSKKKRWLCTLSLALCLPLALGTLSACGGGEGTGKTPATQQTAVEDSKAIGYTALGETEDLDAYAENALEKELEYLLSFEEDRLLYNFYVNAGLPNNDTGARRYDGWENSLIAGHTMGHYLTAVAQAYANAGTSETQKKSLLSKLRYIVGVLKECQEAAPGNNTGAQPGFIWGANNTAHLKDVEFQFNNVEVGKVNIGTEAWVPWYTMHKIIAGLIDVYQETGLSDALTVVSALGDWVYARVSKWSEVTRTTVLSTEYGGMNDCMYELYSITGKPEHAVAAHQFDEDIPTQGTFKSKSMIDHILDEDSNYLRGQHANTTIPKIIGLLNGYIQTKGKAVEGVTTAGDRAVTKTYMTVAELFWERVVEKHSYVTGGNSNDEHFQADESQWSIKSNINCETCNTYNMLKLSRMLFTLTGDKKYLDYYENTYINAILSSQNPETGMTMYFQPMAPGYFKVYSSEFNHFWCCTGSGMESMSKLGDSIYYDAGNATYVAMYFSSSYQTDRVGLTMTADLENSDTVTIHVDSGETILRLRRPDWTTAFSLKVNDNEIAVAADDDFASVEVHAGETVTLTLGKQITVHTLPNAPGVYAFKYGPFVLSAEFGTEHTDQMDDTTGHGVQVKKPNALPGLKTEYQTAKNSLKDFVENINTYMVRGEDGKFTLGGIEGSLTYSIHYKQYTQRYAIYLTFLGEDGEEGETGVEAEEIETVIQPGRGQYEGEGYMTDTDETKSYGSDGAGRYALAGGSFAYWVGVDKTAPDWNFIVTSLAKADNGKTLKMAVGSTVFFEKTLNYTGADDSYDIYIPIPASLVESAQENTLNGSKMPRIKVTVSSAKEGEASAALHTYFKTVKIAGARDEAVAYFVDCGDYDPSTLSSGDKYGLYNSVTEQAYGMDPLTGRMWGVWDEAQSSTWEGAAPVDGSVSTNSTWAQENQNPPVEDGASKTQTNRYTKNQYEKGWQTVKLAYKFELTDGTYQVELYFVDPWGCSKNADVSANGESKLQNVACGQVVTFEVTVSGGELLLEISNPVSTGANELCINLAYIRILYK